MLEKNEKKLYFDAHFHLADCIYDGIIKDSFPSDIYACTCSHSKEEWDVVQKFIGGAALRQAQGPQGVQGPQIFLSYGLHPQSAGYIDVNECADFLEKLLAEKKLNAIGEAGFDYFNDEFKARSDVQEKIFNIQLELAMQYNLPLVIHCRKANEKLFEYSKQLKKLPAVLFHSFMGMPSEALSLLKHGINGYFSFGKQVMNNNKKVIACVRELPQNVLLTETDAPWQFLKGQTHTNPEEIRHIFNAFCEIRAQTPDEMYGILQQNFITLFSVKQ